jgi:hypothetical protein
MSEKPETKEKDTVLANDDDDGDGEYDGGDDELGEPPFVGLVFGNGEDDDGGDDDDGNDDDGELGEPPFVALVFGPSF